MGHRLNENNGYFQLEILKKKNWIFLKVKIIKIKAGIKVLNSANSE